MDLKRLKEVVHRFEDDLHGGLLSCDVFDRDGLSIYGINSNPKACALFSRIADRMVDAMEDSGFPEMEYFTVFAKDNRMVLVAQVNDRFRFGCLVDREKAGAGFVLGVALPRLMIDLEEALSS